jgi:hypothetical protein
MGLNVPEDVTLMWTDDNYGYIRHFHDSVERAPKEETVFIIIFRIGVVRTIIFGWLPHILQWFTRK